MDTFISMNGIYGVVHFIWRKVSENQPTFKKKNIHIIIIHLALHEERLSGPTHILQNISHNNNSWTTWIKKMHYTHNHLAVFDLGAKLSSKSTDLYFFEIYIGLWKCKTSTLQCHIWNKSLLNVILGSRISKNSNECEQFSVNISSVRYIKYIFIIKLTEILSLPWKLSKVTRNLVLQRFPRRRISWTKQFSRGGVVKIWPFFQNFHLGRKIFQSLTKSGACFEIPNIWQKANLSNIYN